MNVTKQQEKLERYLAELKKHMEWSANDPVRLHYCVSEASKSTMLAQDWRRWEEVPANLLWGGAKQHHWFAADITLDGAPDGAELILKIKAQNDILMGRTQGQGLVWLDGAYLQGVDGFHPEIDLNKVLAKGQRAVLHIDHWTGDTTQLCGYSLERYWRDPAAYALYYDLQVPFEVARRLDDSDLRKHAILNLVDEAFSKLDFRNRDGFRTSLPAASAIASQIFELSDTENKPMVSCVGHTHIDVAWLWTVAQTREKMMRSMATALKLLDENPDFVFMYNQCVLFDYLEEDAPELLDRIKQHVKAGRFEIEGAMWLEPDANIISGESMVRHLQRGKRYHQQHFNVDPKILWLPDTFGYSAAMPQIMRKAGVETFVTSKLSWNDTNRMPYDAFFWQGIDGTDVKAYLITTQKEEDPTIRTNYGPDLDASWVRGAWNRFEPKNVHDNVLVPYGHADGGGGVTQEMIEVGRRMQRGIPGCPNVTFEGITPFIDRLGAKMAARPDHFPKWVGELYLEYHRGTLTSLAKNKRNNRLAENRLRDLEFVLASNRLADEATELPSADLSEFWRVTLLNQFHDILPGTSIGEVYEDSDKDYAALFVDSEAMLIKALKDAIHTPFAVVNPYGQTRHGECVAFPEVYASDGQALVTEEGTVPLQSILRADGAKEWLAPIATLPAAGVTGFWIAEAECNAGNADLQATERSLENAHLHVAFADNGEITSVIDKATNRELLKPGTRANQLLAFEDKPVFWDAWDVEWYFDQKSWPVDTAASFELIETGPHRAALRIERTYSNSKIVQIVSLESDAKVLEFDTFADWNESQTLLKAGFDFALNATEIKSEIQFGHVTRPTHANTSWDAARFEASMHRWVAMSEGDYVVGLINDSKYGYDARGQRIRISLIKSGTYPFEFADREHHRCRYGLTFATGPDALAILARRAESFSHPLVAHSVGAENDVNVRSSGLLETRSPNIAVHAITPHETTDEIIIRLVEESNCRTLAKLAFGFPVKSARIIDLMDKHQEDLEVAADGTVAVPFKAFEIITLAVAPQRKP